MNDVMKKDCIDVATEVVKSADIKITLEQWPCAVAILGICATSAFVSWVNQPVKDIEAV